VTHEDGKEKLVCLQISAVGGEMAWIRLICFQPPHATAYDADSLHRTDARHLATCFKSTLFTRPPSSVAFHNFTHFYGQKVFELPAEYINSLIQATWLMSLRCWKLSRSV